MSTPPVSDYPVLCDCLGPGAEIMISRETRTFYCGRCMRSFDAFDLAVQLLESGKQFVAADDDHDKQTAIDQ